MANQYLKLWLLILGLKEKKIMQNKISIIVPVYKVEKELDRCVQSLIKQTYENLEIILVDDGSPDHCPELCEQYAVKDKRICVIHKENGGLSDARNEGLKRATGEYVLYVDSDDYIELDSCERLVNATHGDKVDVVVGNAIMEKLDSIEMMIHSATPNGILYDAKEFVKRAIRASQFYAPAWLNMYRRDFLLKNKLFFKVGIYYEDMQMLPRVFLRAKKVACIDGVFYHYIVRENSIMTSKKDEKKKKDSIQNLKEWKIQFDQIQDNELQKCLYGMLLKCYLHECRLYGITTWKIEGVRFRFALKYALGLKNRLKTIFFEIAPAIYTKIK